MTFDPEFGWWRSWISDWEERVKDLYMSSVCDRYETRTRGQRLKELEKEKQQWYQ